MYRISCSGPLKDILFGKEKKTQSLLTDQRVHQIVTPLFFLPFMTLSHQNLKLRRNASMKVVICLFKIFSQLIYTFFLSWFDQNSPE